ncbi:hypothetical protein VZT92_002496 [Zoarces viviparus]|uniref:Ig-like domain-containing protein n=1 Tax=Zoarces viviparus TaxID=48416 RepID=A0AAW1FYA0_ZOAVI
MNMASMGILLIFTVISISVGNAQTGFPSLKCKAENLGQYGQQSLLECVINAPHDDTEILVVTWKKASRPLLVFHKGDLKEEPGYSFAEPSWNIRNMNVSLLITNTAVEHDGLYECMVVTDRGRDKNNTISLKVTAKYSKPTILSNPEAITLDTDGTLTCKSDSGYPGGKLRWFDERDRELTKDSQMEAKPTESGLFQLSSKLVLGQAADVSEYTCGVFNASGGKEQEATFKVNTPKPPEKGFRKELNPATKIAAPVVVIGSLIVGLLLTLLIYRKQSQREHHKVGTSDGEEGDEKC